MAVNFTVIFSTRQHFGNEQNTFPGQGGIFVGKTKDYVFDCPDVNANETAVLLFQSYDVTTGRDVFAINGTEVYGGLPVGAPGVQHGFVRSNFWMSHVLLVEPRHALKATGNVLHVESKAATASGSDIDDFILDNMVIMYKTAASGPVIL
jgi:hypothetical protein